MMKRYDESKVIDIGYRIRKLREDRGYKREELLQEFGMSYNVLFNIETSKSEPSLDLIVKFANKFNVRLDFLITGKVVHNDS